MSDLKKLIEDVGTRYLKWWKTTSDGRNIYGACPFHVEKTEGAFYMSTETGMFICHGCQIKGSLYTFLKEIGAPRKLRAVIMDRAGPELTKRTRKDEKIGRSDPIREQMVLNEGLLGIFDYHPVDLVDAGFDKKVLQEYEVGFDKEEMRITFPIRNHLGALVGISGRTVIDEVPRYKFYKEPDLIKYSEDYKGYDFQKKNYLWNMHRVYPLMRDESCGKIDVFIVEGFKAALWLIQHGYEYTVALMGTYLSFMQRRLLQRLAATIYIFLDNTEQARDGVCAAGKVLSRSHRVRVCEYPRHLPDNAQPDDMTADELETTARTAETFSNWRVSYERRLRLRRRTRLPAELRTRTR